MTVKNPTSPPPPKRIYARAFHLARPVEIWGKTFTPSELLTIQAPSKALLEKFIEDAGLEEDSIFWAHRAHISETAIATFFTGEQIIKLKGKKH